MNNQYVLKDLFIVLSTFSNDKIYYLKFTTYSNNNKHILHK